MSPSNSKSSRIEMERDICGEEQLSSMLDMKANLCRDTDGMPSKNAVAFGGLLK
jgi:hypothetical protein